MKLHEKLRNKFIRKMMSLAQESVGEIEDGLTSSAEAVSVCRRAAAEGCILLKNTDNVLPINKEDKVAVFGRCQLDYFYVGYGSGGDVRSPYRISPMAAFEEQDFPFDEELALIYKEWTKENRPDDGAWGFWPTCYDEMPLKRAVAEEAALRCNKAIVFLGRSSGEDREAKQIPGSWYLTKDEERMLLNVSKTFEDVCVVINAGSFFDMSWIEKYKIKAVLQAWQGGQESGRGLCDVLMGKVNPSGRLTSTIAALEAYPSTETFGDKSGAVYTEDIYVGYRYFETFDKAAVLYPYGFGLSYTTFNIEDAEVNYIDGLKYELTAKVVNTGNVTGRQVVQAYVKVPQGKLGQADILLGGFAKTAEIKPGESCEVTIEIDLEWLASYDDTGATGNKNSYVLEEGTYEFYVGANVRDIEKVSESMVPMTVIRTTKHLCAPVKEITRLTRGVNGEKQYEVLGVEESDVKERILAQLPEEIPMTGDLGYKFSDVANGKVTMDQFVAQLTAEELENLTRGDINSMNSQYGPVGNASVFGATSENLVEKGIPSISTNDGPSGVRLQAHSTLFPIGMLLSSSFDLELIEKVAHELGKEVKERNSHCLLAPGMNIHRNPLCGRNFEYFGEDPLATGLMATAYVKGVQSAGVSAVPKHLACNNQETGRNGGDSVLSTRAFREIYLRGFEICVKKAKPDFIMTSYNRLNSVLNSYNFDLCTEVMRNELGFEGLFMTDWWTIDEESHEFPGIISQGYRVRAGNDLLMPGGVKPIPFKKSNSNDSVMMSLEAENGLTIGELQRVAKRVLTYSLKYVK